MPVTFATFKIKYPGFADIKESQFNLFLADAIADVDRYKWEPLGANFQNFKDRAIENLIACNLSTLNPELLGAGGLSEFEVREAGFRVKYGAGAAVDGKGESKNPYCLNYAKLLQDLLRLTPDKSKLPAASTYIKKNVYWG